MKIDQNKLDQEMVRRISMEVDLSAALDAAIKLGKEFALRMEEEKPVTRCIITKILFQETKKRFPVIFEHLDKLGV